MPLTKTKLAIMESVECVDNCRAHSLTEQHLTNAPSRTDNSTRAPTTQGGRPPAKGRQEADQERHLCLSPLCPLGQRLEPRGFAPLWLSRMPFPFAEPPKGEASSEKGVSERARENQGGKTTGWRSAVYTAYRYICSIITEHLVPL